MKLDFSRTIWAIMVLALMFFTISFVIQFMKVQNYRLEVKNLQDTIEKLKKDSLNFELIRSSDSGQIVKRDAIITYMEDAHRQQLENDRIIIMELQAKVKLKQKVRIDTIYIPYYIDTSDAEVMNNADRVDSVAVPQSFMLSQTWMTIGGKILKKGIRIDSLIIPNEQKVTIEGKRERGLFKKTKYYAKVENTNKYVSTSAFQSIVEIPKDERRWLQYGKWTLAGVLAGLAMR